MKRFITIQKFVNYSSFEDCFDKIIIAVRCAATNTVIFQRKYYLEDYEEDYIRGIAEYMAEDLGCEVKELPTIHPDKDEF